MAEKFDFESWLERQSKKYGIPVENLRRAFHDEIMTIKNIDEPLEVPDRMVVNYKYSYGQQSRFFRELRDNKKLFGSRCSKCKKTYCPPRAACPRCYVDTEWVELSGEGNIVTFTTVYVSTSEFVQKVPFICAYIKLDGTDFVMMSNVLMDDVTQAKPGMRVKAVFKDERDGKITDFYFVPVTPRS